MVEADGIEKRYALAAPRRIGFRSRPGADAARSWHLGPISFRVPRGEALAIVGRNGSGKSTLLRLLGGTARPSAGRLRVTGRVGRLLDLGSGFQEEWNGRENAEALLRLHGLPARRISPLLADVEAFAGIGEFLEAPVRTYSSGMRLRLAYAIAVAVPPDVLIVDEVLAVGDEAFQKKCSLHIARFLETGGTMVMATHNLYQAEKLCGRAIWLAQGRVAAEGSCHEVTKAYRDSQRLALRAGPGVPSAAPSGTGHVRVDGAPGEGPRLQFGREWRFRVSGEGPLVLQFVSADGSVVASIRVPAAGCVRLPEGSLLPGSYELRLLRDASGREELLDSLACDVVGSRRELGVALLPHEWQ